MNRDPLLTVLPLLEVRPARVLRAMLLGALALGCSVGLAAVSAWLIARASQMPPVLTLSVAVVTVRACGVGRGVLRYLERLASHDVALGGMSALRANLYDALARGPVTGVVALRRGDLLARVGADVDAVGEVVVKSLVPAGVAVLVGLGSVALVGAFLPSAAVALLGCLLLTGVLAPWLAARASAATEAAGAAARAEVTTRALGLLEEGQQLRVAGRLGDELAALDAADARLTTAGDDGARTAGVSAAIGAVGQTLSVVAALALGMAALSSGGALAPVELAVVVLTPLAVFEVTGVLPAAAVQLRRSREAAARLAALLPPADAQDRQGTLTDQPARPTATPGPSQARPHRPGQDDAPRGLLALTDVAAGWPGAAAPAVGGVDLVLAPGDVVALAGPSGVGKTTLLMTAAGLLPPRSGTVTAALGTTTLFVAEDGHVFDTTVLENLRVARGDVTPGDARVALDAVGLTPWLTALPAGLDTLLGGGATTVSGGERRRLLVARALLSPARVLLVDEPAEHLDAAAADAVVAALAAHARATGRAVVVATHRLAAAHDADEVLLLAAATPAGTTAPEGVHEPARVVARAPHADLVRDDADYAWAAAREATHR
ncbi:thiol reductant ABC exporter subunit CydC [Xylanimonas allomyrinae]|uniref:Thiol reductant ABC exporter subunit CydC n=1 Tax=Xylanimonas allomyrinae TaxID=2509459 RepID=A0A4P6EKE6_9MICO|nr:thiol reductant ABC exporter subunit CydC [Xylanimonas allomyrinae]QAY62113.1 thiol reductant ABC exporter subunit CydC [Xylanimonas allomyrinae]